MVKAWQYMVAMLLVCVTAYSQPQYALTIDYGRMITPTADRVLGKSFIINAGFDVYNNPQYKPISLVMGMRMGAVKIDNQYDAQYEGGRVWGTSFQAGYVMGMQFYKPIGDRNAFRTTIMAGPMYMLNMEWVGEIDKPNIGIITEFFAGIELSYKAMLGFKYICYPTIMDTGLESLSPAMYKGLALAVKVNL